MLFSASVPADPDADLRRRADENFCEMFRILAHGAATTSELAAVRERRDGTLIATSVPVPLFNPGFVRTGAWFADLVAEAGEFYARRRLPWTLVLPDHVSEPPSRAAMARADLYALQSMPVYTHPTRPGAAWPPAAGPPNGDADLEIREGDLGSAVAADHRVLLAAGFGIPAEMSRVVLPDAAPARTSRLRLYVAYRNNEPVGCAALCAAGGVAGVYNVAAHPEHRRRGIATVLMRRVLDDARARGLDTCILQSSTAGLPLYNRLGFRRLATYAIYRGGNPGTV